MDALNFWKLDLAKRLKEKKEVKFYRLFCLTLT